PCAAVRCSAVNTTVAVAPFLWPWPLPLSLSGLSACAGGVPAAATSAASARAISERPGLGTCPSSGSARDRGHQHQAVAVLHGRVEAVLEADVLLVQEDVDEAVELALRVEQAPVELLVPPRQVAQHVAHGRAGELQARGSARVPAQRGRYA